MQTDPPPYTLIRKQIRSVRMTVRPPDGEVRVSAPRHVAKREIDRFVASRAEWIAEHQARIAAAPPPLEAGPEAEELRAELRARVEPMLAEWAERMGLLPVPPYIIRRMTSRWGTCNVKTRRITFALELARRDDEKLEYVVVHELAHLIEIGHNQRFYAVMDRHLPEWRRIRRELNGK